MPWNRINYFTELNNNISIVVILTSSAINKKLEIDKKNSKINSKFTKISKLNSKFIAILNSKINSKFSRFLSMVDEVHIGAIL